MDVPMWPRTKIELLQGEHVVLFDPRTLSMLEIELKQSALEFAERWQGADVTKVPIFGLGFPLLLASLRTVVPDMSAELLGERVIPEKFLDQVRECMRCWMEAVGMLSKPLAEAAANPPPAAGASAS